MAGGKAFGSAVADVASREFAEGENIFLLSLIGLLPFACLSFFTFLMAQRTSPRRLAFMAVGGLVGILAYMVPAHVAVWQPLYTGGHVSSTSALVFLFVPFYCVPVLVIGIIIGWVVSKLLPARAR